MQSEHHKIAGFNNKYYCYCCLHSYVWKNRSDVYDTEFKENLKKIVFSEQYQYESYGQADDAGGYGGYGKLSMFNCLI